MASRPSTAEDHLMDGVPVAVDELDEITGRIEVLESERSEKMSPNDVGRVLASFESQLMELNIALSSTAKAGVRKLSRECRETEEEVHDLNLELKIAVRETG